MVNIQLTFHERTAKMTTNPNGSDQLGGGLDSQHFNKTKGICLMQLASVGLYFIVINL